MIGTKWPIIGSKGDKYVVQMHGDGFSCDCPAFRKCKHINMIEARIVA